MGIDTLKKIGEVTMELFLVDGISPFGGVGNMLYGLYDGLEYEEEFRLREDMKVIKREKLDLDEKILNICKDIDTYPKYEYDVTEH